MAPNFDYERRIGRNVVGLDEVGCGAWAGPVVAGACLVRDEAQLPPELLVHVNDSKQVTKKRRVEINRALSTLDRSVLVTAVGVCSVAEIERLNIKQAALEAMFRAYQAIVAQVAPQRPDGVIIDGLQAPKAFHTISLPIMTLCKGDRLSISIALASIIAKVYRDELMATLHHDYPDYGWGRNAGYGTKIHRDALDTVGVTPHHRRAYAPVQRVLRRQAHPVAAAQTPDPWLPKTYERSAWRPSE